MRQNPYDNNVFFEKYSNMSRSVKGLEGAGEWNTLRELLPKFEGKTVLDLGCGYGWHCIYAAEKGAKAVIGVDVSEKMLEVAREKTGFANVTYQRCAMEDVSFPDESFDIVLSSLALHYVKSFRETAENVYRMLRPGGVFLFSAEHPIFTAEGSQKWYCGEDGEILHFPVDHYFYEGRREADFLGETVIKYHKTLTTYLDGLLTSGFTIKRVVEPMPPEDMMEIPGMKDEMRRPMMLIVLAEKITGRE